jgi:hypothetical protein
MNPGPLDPVVYPRLKECPLLSKLLYEPHSTNASLNQSHMQLPKKHHGLLRSWQRRARISWIQGSVRQKAQKSIHQQHTTLPNPSLS